MSTQSHIFFVAAQHSKAFWALCRFKQCLHMFSIGSSANPKVCEGVEIPPVAGISEFCGKIWCLGVPSFTPYDRISVFSLKIFVQSVSQGI